MNARARCSVLALSLLLVGCAGPMRVGMRAWEAGDGPRALAEWTPLAEAGDAEAQFLVALAHEEGRGGPPDAVVAARWYRAAAEQGHAGAQTNLGLLHYRGVGVERSVAEAARWYRAAADQGFAAAQNNLAVLGLLGQDGANDEARALLDEAAAGGDPRATELVGLLADGTRLDQHVASRDYEARAGAGEAEAQYLLGLRSFHGEDADPAAAAPWFERAADQGHAKAATFFARLLLQGDGVERDDARAAAYLKVAADQGLAHAQHDLALLHLRGRGVERDDALGLDLLARAARQDHRASVAKLGILEHAVWQHRLTDIRAGRGIPVPADPAAAPAGPDDERVARVGEDR